MNRSVFPFFRLLLCIVSLMFLTGCDKGYRLRVSNYYTATLDSVIVGERTIVVKDLAPMTSSEYQKIKRGQYFIRLMSGNKTFTTSIFIPGKGEGNRSVQIDGIEQVSIIEQ